jgi:hypothetical protein
MDCTGVHLHIPWRMRSGQVPQFGRSKYQSTMWEGRRCLAMVDVSSFDVYAKCLVSVDVVVESKFAPFLSWVMVCFVWRVHISAFPLLPLEPHCGPVALSLAEPHEQPGRSFCFRACS